MPPRAASTSYASGSCSRVPVPIQLSTSDSEATAREVAKRRTNYQLPEPSPQDQQELHGKKERANGKVYMHCSELSKVKYDPYTEHLLARSVQQALHHARPDDK